MLNAGIHVVQHDQSPAGGFALFALSIVPMILVMAVAYYKNKKVNRVGGKNKRKILQ